MGSTRHEKSFVDYDKPYEQNLIGLKGIVLFGAGLFGLIVITFLLMWALLNVLEDQRAETEAADQNPMAMNDRERLPPEPRLQAAPGFGVDSPGGRVNLELNAPQSEYWELKKQWDTMLAEGQRDPSTGAVAMLPIEQAKELTLQSNPKARQAPDAAAAFEESRLYVIDSSSGRQATIKRR